MIPKTLSICLFYLVCSLFFIDYCYDLYAYLLILLVVGTVTAFLLFKKDFINVVLLNLVMTPINALVITNYLDYESEVVNHKLNQRNMAFYTASIHQPLLMNLHRRHLIAFLNVSKFDERRIQDDLKFLRLKDKAISAEFIIYDCPDSLIKQYFNPVTLKATHYVSFELDAHVRSRLIIYFKDGNVRFQEHNASTRMKLIKEILEQ